LEICKPFQFHKNGAKSNYIYTMFAHYYQYNRDNPRIIISPVKFPISPQRRRSSTPSKRSESLTCQRTPAEATPGLPQPRGGTERTLHG